MFYDVKKSMLYHLNTFEDSCFFSFALSFIWLFRYSKTIFIKFMSFFKKIKAVLSEYVFYKYVSSNVFKPCVFLFDFSIIKLHLLHMILDFSLIQSMKILPKPYYFKNCNKEIMFNECLFKIKYIYASFFTSMRRNSLFHL